MRKTLILLFSLYFSVLLFPEENITQDKGYINRNFKVYVKTMVPYSRDLEVELPLGEDDRLILAGDPYLRPYNALTDNRGEIIYEDMTEIVLTFRASEGDIFSCRGLKLYRQKFELEIPEFPVIVHNRDEINLNYPVQLYWSPVKETAYPGEIISLVLNVRYTESLEFPEEIGMSKPAGGNLDQVDLPGSIETYEINDNSVYAYPLESWYFSSGESGHMTLPGGNVSILGLIRKIPPLEIEILPLPEDIKQSGAVGDFSLVTRISREEAIQGEIVTLTVRIEGTGNFHYLSFPEVVTEGFELINSDETEELLPTEAGYSGFRERTYRFQAGHVSRGRIICSPFSWFDPLSQSVSSYPGDTYDIGIIVQGSGENEKLTLLTSSQIEWLIIKELFNGPLKWILLIPGLSYFLFSLFSLNEKKKSQMVLLLAVPFLLSMSSGSERRRMADEARDLYGAGQLSESRAIYQELYDEENRSAYLYNLAVLEYYQGNLVESEILFRRALLALPGEYTFLKGLAEMENLAGLKDQYVVDWGIGAGGFHLLLLILLNMFLVTLARYLKKRRISLLLVMASLFFVTIGISVGSLTLSWMNERPQGVVDSEGGELRRIPEETAQDWLNLASGTSLRLIKEKRGHYFIRTGYGLEGWIETDYIIPVKEGGL